MSKDILLYENGSGGELSVMNNDIQLVETLYQQVYLRLFGGNIEASTTGSETQTQERKDWWANSLFFSDLVERQFNSETERTLQSVALNTAGRIDIARAVEKDLETLLDIANITVNVVILSEAKVRITVALEEPDALQDKILQFIWDNASQEVIIEEEI